MISKLRQWWQETRSSFWFVPATIVSGASLLAIGLIALDSYTELDVAQRGPLIFGAGAAGSRGFLAAVAGSMITVAGVVFSITIVALSLTSSQYTSRVLRNFMRDRINQAVLGVFVGIFAYCLIVLRTIRGGDEGAFVPSLAVLGGLVLAFVGIAFLIVFIHHIATSIQASSILAIAARETIAAVDRLFPESLGAGQFDQITDQHSAAPAERNWLVLKAIRTGYLESVDHAALLRWLEDHHTTLRLERNVGDFVIEDTPLISLADGEQFAPKYTELISAFQISQQRTLQQDAAFGIRQIVDVALKALSPGINDSTTAVMCVDYLAAILVRLAKRAIAPAEQGHQCFGRVIIKGPTFSGLLAESFDQIRQNAGKNAAVLMRLLDALERVADETLHQERRAEIGRHVKLIAATVRAAGFPAHEGAPLEAAALRLSQLLEKEGPS